MQALKKHGGALHGRHLALVSSPELAESPSCARFFAPDRIHTHSGDVCARKGSSVARVKACVGRDVAADLSSHKKLEAELSPWWLSASY